MKLLFAEVIGKESSCSNFPNLFEEEEEDFSFYASRRENFGTWRKMPVKRTRDLGTSLCQKGQEAVSLMTELPFIHALPPSLNTGLL